MKLFLIIFFIGLSSFSFGQSKYGYVHFDKLIEVKGTEYVIASIENRGKVFDVNEEKLLFINTMNGETKQIMIQTTITSMIRQIRMKY